METSKLADSVPLPILEVFRGVAQVFFQENALTGAFMVVGLAINSPLMATGAVVGSAIGTATAYLLKYDAGEIKAGIYGFNSTLIGIAVFFHFLPSPIAIGLLIGGSALGTVVTYLMRRFVPIPTYTSPFIVTTWGVFFLGIMLQAEQVKVQPGDAYFDQSIPGFASVEGEVSADGKPAKGESAIQIALDFMEAVGRSIGEVDFQGSIWTGLLFLIGIAINDKEHAAWVFAASLIATLVAVYHHDPSGTVALGVDQYSAPLAAVGVYLWRKSLIAPILGILLTVPLTEFFPLTHLPTYTAPFVLATWIVLLLGYFENRFFGTRTPAV